MVWGKSKDRQNTNDIGKGESQELPINLKNGAKSASDIFDGIEINVPARKNVPPVTTTTS